MLIRQEQLDESDKVSNILLQPRIIRMQQQKLYGSSTVFYTVFIL